MIIYGKNPLLEAIRAGKIIKGFIKKGDRFEEEFRKNNIRFEELESKIFDQKFSTEAQGAAAEVQFDYLELDDCLDDFIKGGKIIILDHIHDPHNFGAIVRAGHCFGIKHFMIAKDNQVQITPAVFKASAGSMIHSKIIKVTNIARSLDVLKEAGFFVYAADMDAEKDILSVKPTGKSAIIIGSEGYGIRPNVLKRADMSFKIPMTGKIDSLNASQSAAIIFYEFTKL